MLARRGAEGLFLVLHFFKDFFGEIFEKKGVRGVDFSCLSGYIYIIIEICVKILKIPLSHYDNNTMSSGKLQPPKLKKIGAGAGV